jgi:hypothetical protein
MNQLSGTTLENLANEYDQPMEVWGGPTRDLRFNLEANGISTVPHIAAGTAEIPVTKAGLSSLATFLGIPPKFLLRIDPDEQQAILRTRSQRVKHEEVTLYYRNGGLQEVRKAGETRVRPERLIESVMQYFPSNSPIVEHWNTPDELRVDVIYPEGHEHGIGGDIGIGDITRGGVRIGQDRKHNLAPYVQPFLYRLRCTNGMEIPDEGLKISAVGAKAAEIEALFEAAIAQAVARVEDDIHAFYDLRNQTLGNDPTGALHRAATEQGLPLRTIGRMEDLVPALLEESGESGEITMFDVINLMTNQANDPKMASNRSGRRNLQTAGGTLVNDHAERCSTCHSRLQGR